MTIYSESEYQAMQRRAKLFRWWLEFLAGVACGLVIWGLIILGSTQ